MQKHILGRGLRRSVIAAVALLAVCSQSATGPRRAGALGGPFPAPQLAAAAQPSPSHVAAVSALSQVPVLEAAVPPRRALDTSVPFRQLRTAPESGPVGTSFTLRGEGLSPGQEVELQWATWQGSYATKPSAERVAYESRQFTAQRQVLGRVRADAQGAISGSYVAPEDFGELHEIFAVVDGEEVARGGFRIKLAASIEPAEGPVGTPVTVTVTGMAAKLFSGATLALRYDNAYTGVLTATTTRGTARAEFRAAGPVGQHVVMINAGSVPAYLNIAQSPYAFVYEHIPTQENFRLPFLVTADQGPPANSVAWPLSERVQPLPANAMRTTASGAGALHVKASFTPAAGTVFSKPLLQVEGLEPNAPVDAFWMTARGNRVTASGWSLADIPLGTVTADSDGRISGPVEVPDDLGGWHALKLVQHGQVVAAVPYFVERSLVSVSATQLRAGESFTVNIKGVGWTELDNGFAMTYDNAYAGYACGFNSNGDVTLELVATGGPGTHLIDLYPMVYAGKDTKWWYWTPVLTYSRDFPALSLGYRLPAFRLAIAIID
jgi:hypothetical protein